MGGCAGFKREGISLLKQSLSDCIIDNTPETMRNT